MGKASRARKHRSTEKKTSLEGVSLKSVAANVGMECEMDGIEQLILRNEMTEIQTYSDEILGDWLKQQKANELEKEYKEVNTEVFKEVGNVIQPKDYEELAMQAENLIVDLATKKQENHVLRSVVDQLRDQVCRLTRMVSMYRNRNNEEFCNTEYMELESDSTVKTELVEAREAQENSDKLVNSMRLEQMAMTSERHALQDKLEKQAAAHEADLETLRVDHKADIERMLRACAVAFEIRSETLTGEELENMEHIVYMVEQLDLFKK